MTSYLALIPARVAGIPCQIGVERYVSVAPWRGSALNCPSDADFYGYTEAEWRLLDRRGRPAEWLERKATDHDHERIEHQIDNYLRGAA